MTTTYLATVANNLIEQDIADYEQEHGPMGYALAKKYRKLLVDVEHWKLDDKPEMIRGLIQSYKL